MLKAQILPYSYGLQLPPVPHRFFVKQFVPNARIARAQFNQRWLSLEVTPPKYLVGLSTPCCQLFPRLSEPHGGWLEGEAAGWGEIRIWPSDSAGHCLHSLWL